MLVIEKFIQFYVFDFRCHAFTIHISFFHSSQGYFGNLRHEMFEYGIDVTLICPGSVHSEFQSSQLTHDGKVKFGVQMK